ncbi:hypothetical protein D3Z58_26355, partial [Clostridiaceae bacterium]|nr:hypothetical protein [Clostridiaceae bacterium]
LSPSATMAQINSKVDVNSLEGQESTSSTSEAEVLVSSSTDKPSSRRGFPRAVIIGGALALVCTLDRGLLTKAVIFGVARKFARTGQRL